MRPGDHLAVHDVRSCRPGRPKHDLGELMIALILRYWQIGAGAAAGALLGWAATFAYVEAVSLPAARSQGRDAYIANQAAATAKAELERKGDDAKLQGMSDFDLCVAGLGGLRDASPCDELRGLHGEQPVPGGDGGADQD